MTETLAAAEAHCRDNGLRLTPVRRRVLELLLADHKAQGAYDILASLQKEGHGAQPPVAYRALDFLTRIGFVHRIACRNAYVACAHAGARHRPAFMICRTCGTVAEATTPADDGALDAAAREAGFEIESAVVEAEGLCPECRVT